MFEPLPNLDGLIIFIKNPQLGKVKTRLAASLGDQQALVIYHQLLAFTQSVAQQVDCRRFLFYSDFIDHTDEWPPEHFEKRIQAGKDLGERMQNAFADILAICSKTIIIGSDCPLISSHHITAAFSRLDTVDVVVGPSLDGGYYLLGLKSIHAGFFQNIAWSTETVLATTLSRAQEAGLTHFCLDALPDIDYEEDWIKYGQRLQARDRGSQAEP